MPAIAIPNGHTREELLACVDREVALRLIVYPRRVAAKQITTEASLREIDLMRTVRAVLAQLPPTQGGLDFGRGPSR